MTIKKRIKKISQKIRYSATLPYEMIAAGFGWFFMPLNRIQTFKYTYGPLFSIINKMFTRSFTSTFLAFWFPFLIVVIVSPLFSPQLLYIGTLGIIPMVIAVEAMPAILIELKMSAILKRIGTTSIKTGQLITALMIYFSGIAVLSFILNAAIGFVLLQNNELFINSQIDWGFLILTMVYSIPICLGLGILVASLCKSAITASGIGIIIILLGALVSGQFVPITAIISEWGNVRYIAYLFPQTYYSKLMFLASNGDSLFSLKDQSIINYDLLQMAINFKKMEMPDLFGVPIDEAISLIRNKEALTSPLGGIIESTKPIMISYGWETMFCLGMPIIIMATLIPTSISTFKWQGR